MDENEACLLALQRIPTQQKQCQLIAQAARHRKFAFALRQLGWTQWLPPMAPQAAATRKVPYCNKARKRHFRIFPLIYWCIHLRICECLAQARQHSAAQGHQVKGHTGQKARSTLTWRALGKTLVDIRLLVFSMGRADYRAGPSRQDQNSEHCAGTLACLHPCAHALPVSSSLSIFCGLWVHGASRSDVTQQGTTLRIEDAFRSRWARTCACVCQRRGSH